MGMPVPSPAASQPGLHFPSSPGWFFLSGHLMFDLKERTGGTERVVEVREHPCEELHPQQFQFPPKGRSGMGGLKAQEMPQFLPGLRVLLVLK